MAIPAVFSVAGAKSQNYDYLILHIFEAEWRLGVSAGNMTQKFKIWTMNQDDSGLTSL
jgi:hypothetical protein